MPDLSNPVVTVSYECGCTFVDDTETGGKPTFSFGGDEQRMFQLKRAYETAKTKQEKQKLVRDALDTIADQTGKPVATALDAKPDADSIYQALLARDATDVRRVTEDVLDDKGQKTGRTVTFPQPPAACPRHNRPAVHVHASYLNPADTPPADAEGAKP